MYMIFGPRIELGETKSSTKNKGQARWMCRNWQRPQSFYVLSELFAKKCEHSQTIHETQIVHLHILAVLTATAGTVMLQPLGVADFFIKLI